MKTRKIIINKWNNILIFLAIITVIFHIIGFFLVYKKASRAFTVPFMTSYRGDACLITGVIKFKDYNSGSIFVLAKRTPREILIPDTAMAKLTSPGFYSIEVPAHIDKISLIAVNSKEPYKGVSFSKKLPFGHYSKNPLIIKGKKIITNIDITVTLNNNYEF